MELVQGGMDRKPPTVPHAGRYDSSLILKQVPSSLFLAIVLKNQKLAGLLEKNTCFLPVLIKSNKTLIKTLLSWGVPPVLLAPDRECVWAKQLFCGTRAPRKYNNTVSYPDKSFQSFFDIWQDHQLVDNRIRWLGSNNTGLR